MGKNISIGGSIWPKTIERQSPAKFMNDDVWTLKKVRRDAIHANRKRVAGAFKTPRTSCTFTIATTTPTCVFFTSFSNV